MKRMYIDKENRAALYPDVNHRRVISRLDRCFQFRNIIIETLCKYKATPVAYSAISVRVFKCPDFPCRIN